MTTDKTPATLAVDVLAVINREILRAGGVDYSDGRDLIAARAAVAELVEADEEYNRAREAWLASPGEHDDFQATRDAWKRRMKALARVKGESA